MLSTSHQRPCCETECAVYLTYTFQLTCASSIERGKVVVSDGDTNGGDDWLGVVRSVRFPFRLTITLTEVMLYDGDNHDTSKNVGDGEDDCEQVRPGLPH